MNAIFQIYIGERSKATTYCMSTVASYAKRIGADYLALTEPKLFKQGLHQFEKILVRNILLANDSNISRVAYVDSDIIVTPQAKNIFEENPDEDYLYGYDENSPFEWMDRDKYIPKELANSIGWTINEKGKLTYINTGVMLFSKKQMQKIDPFAGIDFNNQDWFPNEVFEKNNMNIMYFGEQTLFNYWFQKAKIPIKSLDASYNRMDLGVEDPFNLRYKSNFIHYAGPCRYGNKNKEETILKDYNILYVNG